MSYTTRPYDFDRILRHAAKLGFDGVELFGMPDKYPSWTLGADCLAEAG